MHIEYDDTVALAAPATLLDGRGHVGTHTAAAGSLTHLDAVGLHNVSHGSRSNSTPHLILDVNLATLDLLVDELGRVDERLRCEVASVGTLSSKTTGLPPRRCWPSWRTSR